MGTVASGEGSPIEIFNRNAPAFYCVPAKVFEALMERLDDWELNAVADIRMSEQRIKVRLEDL